MKDFYLKFFYKPSSFSVVESKAASKLNGAVDLNVWVFFPGQNKPTWGWALK
jgi:hypothetical protein